MTHIHPANFEEKTGFDQIRQILEGHCYGTLGQKQIREIRFLSQASEIGPLLDQAEEFRQILLGGERFPGSDYYDPTALFERLKPADTYAEPEELSDIKRSLTTILAVLDFLARTTEEDKPRYPALAALTEGVQPDSSLPGRIHALIDEQGQVRSSASVRLTDIREEMDKLSRKALQRINSLFSEGKSQGWISKDSELALRNGRQVIPVPVAYKRKLRGFIHDHSSTGQTAFVEPEEVFEINNRIRELEGEERQEIIKLLKAFTAEWRPEIPELKKAYAMLGKMDATRAKALLALDLEASRPGLTNEAAIKWVKARHPLLFLSYKKSDKQVEPLTIELNSEERILVISGPNAGGKSVCLKTCGLIQYMLQCGLLVPMESYSEAGIFHEIFIDIGDEQSIENDLSTYSSHLLNMKHLLERAGSRSLFLIDEFGSGTEPRIGGAIAEAILESLLEKKARGVVTTHYANLKLMAGRQKGMVNGSMLFDSKQMRPLFMLKTGMPGSSFAFEIARTIGLPSHALNRAGELAGDKELDFDIQLQDLEVKKAELESKERQLRHADNFLAEMVDKYEKLRDELQERKNEILNQARREAKGILAGANKAIEKTIREIKEAGAEKERTREVRRELGEYIREQDDQLGQGPPPQKQAEKKKKQAREKPPRKEMQTDSGPIGVGDSVKIKGQETPGEVMDISGKKALVAFGSIQLRIGMEELIKLKKSSVPQTRIGTKKSRLPFDINEKAAAFSPDIDLRGARVDEALQRLQSHMDDAYLLGVPQVRILHGKGDGLLRPAIRKFLQEIPHIGRYRDEHPDRGGAGITIVDFAR